MKVKLGDLTKIRTGKLDANAASDDGLYPFFTCSREPLKISSYSYECECVLVAGNGDLNVKYYNGKFDAYQRTYIIEAKKPDVLYMPYLYYFMEKYVVELRKLAIGGVIKYIKLGNLTDALIELPTYEKQQSLVERLEKVKSTINKRSEQLTKLDELVKCRFVEQFGNCKHVLEGWKRMTIGQACSLVNGRAFKPSDWVKEGTPIVRIQNLKDPTAEFNYCDGNVEGKFWIDTGTLLFAWSGTPGTSFGAFIWAGGKAVLNQHIFQVHPCPDISKQFLKYSFAAHMDEIIEKAHGSAGLRHITKQELEKIMLLIPPMEVQKSFVNFAQQCDKLRFVSAFHQINALLGMQKV